jgi:hypothetical protein
LPRRVHLLACFVFIFENPIFWKKRKKEVNGVRAAQSRPFKDFYVFCKFTWEGSMRRWSAFTFDWRTTFDNIDAHGRGEGGASWPLKTPSKTWSKKHKNRYPLTRFSSNLKYPLQNIFSTSVHLCLTRSPSTQL